MQNTHNIIYETTNKVTGKKYIGVHSADVEQDRYLGSGYLLHRAIKKHGRENFQRDNLLFCRSKEIMYIMEKWFVDDTVVNDPNYYNLKPGGDCGPVMCGDKNPRFRNSHSKETRAKLSKAHTGMDKTWLRGVPKTEECKAMLSLKAKERHRTIGHPMQGKKHSKEIIEKMSNAKRGKANTEEQKKKISKTLSSLKWFHNPETGECTRAVECPDGFIKGRGSIKSRVGDK